MKKLNSFIFLLTLILFDGCDKPNNGSHENLFSTNLKEVNVSFLNYTVSSKKDTVLTGRNNAKYFIPKNCFKGENRLTQIGIKECYLPSDMIMNGLTTTSGNKLLETEGMYFINAKDSLNHELALKNGYHILASLPVTKKNYMSLFLGKEDSVNRFINWKLSESDIVLIPPKLEYLLKTSSNITNLPLLKWVNLDKFLNYNDTINFQIKIIENEKFKSDLLIIFKKMRCIVRGEVKNSYFYFNQIPNNQDVFIVALLEKNSKLYYSIIESNTSKQQIRLKIYKEFNSVNFAKELKTIDKYWQ